MEITITVTTAANIFKVDVKSADLTGNGSGVVPLVWKISPLSLAWKFPSDEPGIEILDDTADVFDPIGIAGSKSRKTIRKLNKHYVPPPPGTPPPGTPPAPKRVYEYSVTITDGITTLIIDPTIINQP